MAYEVTKRIKGREYRYRVEGIRDQATGRTRTHWQYLGRLDGDDVIAPHRAGAPRVTRDELIAVIATLLESRDASRVTVSVIVHHAGVSAGTFYRHFRDRRSALGAAIAHLCEGLLRELPTLAGPIGSDEAERERLFAWFSALQRSILRGRAIRWFLLSADREKIIATEDWSSFADEPQRVLATYLQRLDATGRATIDDAEALARATLRMHVAVVRDLALEDEPGDPSLRLAEVFPLIERAVFPHRLVTA